MRIGIDARLWNESGVGRYTRNLVRELQILDKKNDYVLFTLSNYKNEILKQVQNDNFRIVKADVRWHSLEEQILMPTILSHSVLDLVHFPYFSVPVLYNRPYVVTIHDLILHHFPTGEASTLPHPLYKLKLFGYKFVISHAAKKAKKVIAVSESTKQEIVDHLGVNKNKVAVTYEGVDEKISNIKNQKLNIQTKNQKYFLYVGNAYPHKNLVRLLEALNILISKYPNISLVLVGKNDYFYMRLKEKVSRMKLDEHVVFFGEASDSELSTLYKNALFLISPSLMEGFGLPLLEAMANKCLVLTSDIPIHREICKDFAIYFDPINANDIEEKMKLVCSNDLNHWNTKRKEGLERAKEFSWKKMAEQTLEIYESCLGVR